MVLGIPATNYKQFPKKDKSLRENLVHGNATRRDYMSALKPLPSV